VLLAIKANSSLSKQLILIKNYLKILNMKKCKNKGCLLKQPHNNLANFLIEIKFLIKRILTKSRKKEAILTLQILKKELTKPFNIKSYINFIKPLKQGLKSLYYKAFKTSKTRINP